MKFYLLALSLLAFSSLNAHADVEPNNTLGTATVLSPNVALRGTSSDVDFYRIEVTQSSITINVAFAHAESDIDILLSDSTGGFVQSSASVTDNERIVVNNVTPGTYFLEVQTFSSAYVGTQYEIVWQVDDAFEENDALGTAAPLDAFVTANGLSFDDDWYAIEVSENRIIINALFAPANGNIDLELYDPNGDLFASSTGVNDREQLNLALATSGVSTYFIRVYTAGIPSGTPYQLTWSQSSSANGSDDAFEDNDDLASAVGLPAATQVNAISADEDWYRINVRQSNVQINAAFLDASADIDIELFDALGNQIAASNSSTDNESINQAITTAGAYFIRVITFQNLYNSTSYTLSWSESGGTNTGTVLDDAFEPNNDAAAATIFNESITISALSFDEDWYQIQVTDSLVTVNAGFLHNQGDIDIGLYDASSGDLLGSSITVTDNETIEFEVPANGSYLIRVITAGNYSGTPYTLFWQDSAGTGTGTGTGGGSKSVSGATGGSIDSSGGGSSGGGGGAIAPLLLLMILPGLLAARRRINT